MVIEWPSFYMQMCVGPVVTDFFVGTGYCFAVRVDSMKKNILGSKCEIDGISLRNYKQNFKELSKKYLS